VVGLAGWVAALIALPPDAAGVWLIMGAFGGATASFLERGPVPVDRAAGIRVLMHGLLTAVAFLSVVGLFQLAGDLAMVVYLALAATSPPAIQLLARLADRLPAPRTTPLPAPRRQLRSTRRLSAMSDAELCRAWCASHHQLERSLTARQRVALAQLRGRYLDELSRRNGQAFEAWLSSGPEARSDPSRFFLRPQNR
jgi:hypothetical protein